MPDTSFRPRYVLLFFLSCFLVLTNDFLLHIGITDYLKGRGGLG
jgi:hypothetical protein